MDEKSRSQEQALPHAGKSAKSKKRCSADTGNLTGRGSGTWQAIEALRSQYESAAMAVEID